MSGINVKFKTGPITFEAEAKVTGGQVVVPGTAARTIKPAAAGAANVLGVALTDAAPEGASTNFVAVPTHAAVATCPAVVPIASDGTAAAGDLVVADADGAVKKSAGTETVGEIVGRVIEKKSDTANTVLVRLGI
ncbi:MULTISPECIES: capsid cement protein [Tomitella]|uniref:DUF2190 family protein n=1 Tax=Tomitella cavernea TaxID=1387982 RepID=A0ABP9CER3_9ACTN|nr:MULTISPECIES: capsid cement protein [Tomitella]